MKNVIPLELARRIHEKAMEKDIKLMESEFHYSTHPDEPLKYTIHQGISRNGVLSMYEWFKIYSTYTTDELLEILPAKIMTTRSVLCFGMTKNARLYYSWYGVGMRKGRVWKKTPSQSLWELLLYLMENDLFIQN